MRVFSGKTAVITGGASGIGFAVARALAGRGAKIVLADIEGGALQSAVETLQADGATVIGVQTDVRSREALQKLADASWAEFGAVHFVMHNAGVVTMGPAHEQSDEDWNWTMEVNLNGPIYGVQAFLPRMVREENEGYMLFTSSFAGLVPNENIAPYNVSKAGVVALAESLHKDLRGKPIGVSVLCPMTVESRIRESRRNRPEDMGVGRTYTDEELQNLQGRYLSVEPVAELVVESVMRGDLYIHTHGEALEFLKRRMAKIESTFVHAL